MMLSDYERGRIDGMMEVLGIECPDCRAGRELVDLGAEWDGNDRYRHVWQENGDTMMSHCEWQDGRLHVDQLKRAEMEKAKDALGEFPEVKPCPS